MMMWIILFSACEAESGYLAAPDVLYRNCFAVFFISDSYTEYLRSSSFHIYIVDFIVLERVFCQRFLSSIAFLFSVLI